MVQRVQFSFPKISFHNENKCATDLKCSHHGSVTKKNFHFRSTNTALKQRSTFLSILKNSKSTSPTRRLIQKRILLKNCAKYHCGIAEFRIHAEKDSLRIYKNSADQTFTSSRNKVVYFLKYLAHHYRTLRKRSFHYH